MNATSPTGRAGRDDYFEWRQRIADKQASRRDPQDEPQAKPVGAWDPDALFAKPDEGDRQAGLSPGDPGTIDLREETAPPDPEPERTPEPALDRPPAAVVPAREVAAAPSRRAIEMGPTVEPGPAVDLVDRRAQFESVMARIEPPSPPPVPPPARPAPPSPKRSARSTPARSAPKVPAVADRRAQFDSVMARLEPAPATSTSTPPAAPADSRRATYDAVMARLQRPKPAAAPPPAASVADALRKLNDLRREGDISEDEFKARKAELFGRAPRT